MFKYLSKRSALKKAEIEFAHMRIMLDAIMKLMFADGQPNESAVRIARVGNQVRVALEHRFGWARETSINSDEELRTEEKQIETLSDSDLEKLIKKIDAEADRYGKKEEIDKTMALRLLSGWIACKLIGRKSSYGDIVQKALEHEQLHLDHIRNTMRILRGENPVTSD